MTRNNKVTKCQSKTHRNVCYFCIYFTMVLHKIMSGLYQSTTTGMTTRTGNILSNYHVFYHNQYCERNQYNRLTRWTCRMIDGSYFNNPRSHNIFLPNLHSNNSNSYYSRHTPCILTIQYKSSQDLYGG